MSTTSTYDYTQADWDVETKQGGNFNSEVPSEDAIPSRICALIDVGTHDFRNLKGEVYQRHILMIGYELDEKDSTGKNFFMVEKYTLSLDMKANLYGLVKEIHGELTMGVKFNPGMLAAKPCQVSVKHDRKVKNNKERIYANIGNVMKIGRGQTYPQGGCVVWRVADWGRVPLPDLSYLPSMWHEDSGKMLTIPEWVAISHEVTGANKSPSTAADSRLASGVSQPARDVTPASPPQTQPASPATSRQAVAPAQTPADVEPVVEGDSEIPF